MSEKVKIKGNKSGKGVLAKLNVCKTCNKAFLSNRSTAKVCSNTCKVKSYRMRVNNKLIQEIKIRFGL
jgi:hypothetical protein